MNRPNFYASGGIDRVSHLRRDEAWLRARLDDSATRVVPVWRSHSLMVMDKEPSAVLLAAAEASGGGAAGAGAPNMSAVSGSRSGVSLSSVRSSSAIRLFRKE